ncbi:MAG TPA: L-lactate permease [Acidimicrobiales bacterium]|nr:L-lactate permease [Acidimicrobiales bacterium]
MSAGLLAVFHQPLNPVHSVFGSTLVALAPIVVLLGLLAGLRLSAWKAVIVGAVVTFVLGLAVWGAPLGGSFRAVLAGAGTGIWSIDWITFWGVVFYNTLVVTGAFDDFKRWLIDKATLDIRAQTLLLAWSLGALLEGLVGFGYPWAVVAPILIGFGIVPLNAIRVAAIANNAPVSFGALGVPIISLAAVTGIPLMHLSQSIGRIVAILALAPPWILIVLVTGRKGLRDGWPLAVVGSLSYIVGQYPTSQYLGPYLPDIIGALTSFAALLVLLRFWRPRTVLGFGGVPVTEVEAAPGGGGGGARALTGAGGVAVQEEVRSSSQMALRGFLPFVILIAVVVAWTGPWSSLPKHNLLKYSAVALSSLSHKKAEVAFAFNPGVGGTSILVAWAVSLLYLRPRLGQLREVFVRAGSQMWGALLVGPFIFALADVFNYTGMANSLAYGFSRVGTAFILLSPVLGFIGVALSGSNTATNAVFGSFQLTVGRLLHFPLLLTPSLNSVGAEVGKPIAPQTASVGVSTSAFVRREGDVIRHNFGWTLVTLGYLILIGLLYYYVLPGAMR